MVFSAQQEVHEKAQVGRRLVRHLVRLAQSP
jgi:hypothetical protein